ncbi:MAG TPA: MarR family transcriptional regulator [Vicinamibacteria bacterium]|nr:MarR family transcriptional regulator [Vicinamibacteria bacterium]
MQRQRSLGFLIALAQRRIRQAVAARVSDLDLSPPQFWMMVRILEHEGGSLGELAEQARLDEPTASRVAFALVRRGLVRSEVDPGDRRRSRLLMTPEGRELTRRLLPLSEEIRAAVEGSLTPAEREAVASGLQKVIARLDGMGAGSEEGRVAS